jgi:hypothetical protein
MVLLYLQQTFYVAHPHRRSARAEHATTSRTLPPIDQPLAVSIISNEVVFIGPGRVAFSMTREAAIKTHRRMTQVLAQA